MKQYTLINKLLGPCNDVKTDGNHLFAIQTTTGYPGGRLCVLDGEGNLLGQYVGIGTARQIEIKNGIAVVTARSNNLWIFDIREDEPKLLSHYKTIEYAVGVTLYANLALISCRQYGVEVIDISNPSRPKHVRIIKTGEVQSACVYDGVLYGGIWGTMSVAVFDINDLNNPRHLADIPIQGRGDGVVVKDGILYAVTGQHKRGIQNAVDKDDPCFGHGNGVEMYDVSDPAAPRFLKRQEFGYGHSLSYDMWDANIAGDLVLCNDSVCGVHAYDVKTFEPVFHLCFDNAETAATGLVTFEGKLYVSSTEGLYCFDEYEFEPLYHHDVDATLSADAENFQADSKDLVQRFVGDFPVVAVIKVDKYLALACANDGIRLLDEEYQQVAHCDMTGMCCDLRYHNGLLYAAMAEQGLFVYRLAGTDFTKIAVYTFEKPLLQLDLSESGRFLQCCCGEEFIEMLDVSNPTEIHSIARRDRDVGPLYGANCLSGRLDDGTMLLFWHRDGLVYMNPDAGDREYHNIHYTRSHSFMGFGPETGCDTDGKRIFFNMKALVELPLHECNADEQPHYVSSMPLKGKIIYHDNQVVAAERAKGILHVCDISDVENIRTVKYIRTNASCEKPVVIDGRIFIPGWYGGLLELI